MGSVSDFAMLALVDELEESIKRAFGLIKVIEDVSPADAEACADKINFVAREFRDAMSEIDDIYHLVVDGQD
jgi:hypothetical protein